MSQRGFTLIEVLVASAIFVGVMVIGVSSFSNVNHINDQIQMTRNLSQTGNFVMETLARDIRTATGEKDLSNGEFSNLHFPFDFLNSDNVFSVISALPSSGNIISSEAVATWKSGQYNCYVFTPVDDTEYFNLSLRKDSCLATEINSLLPTNILILDPTFSGISHQVSSTVQPFVTIKFTLVDTSASNPKATSAQMTFQTTVTSLVYAGQ